MTRCHWVYISGLGLLGAGRTEAFRKEFSGLDIVYPLLEIAGAFEDQGQSERARAIYLDLMGRWRESWAAAEAATKLYGIKQE